MSDNNSETSTTTNDLTPLMRQEVALDAWNTMVKVLPVQGEHPYLDDLVYKLWLEITEMA